MAVGYVVFLANHIRCRPLFVSFLVPGSLAASVESSNVSAKTHTNLHESLRKVSFVSDDELRGLAKTIKS